MMLHNMAADGLTKPDLRPKNPVSCGIIYCGVGYALAGAARVLKPSFCWACVVARKTGIKRRLEKYFHSNTDMASM